MGSHIQGLIETDFFIYALPFLLVFALGYALLGSVFKDKKVRTIISAILGALVLPLAPTVAGFLSTLTGSFLIVIGVILVLVILLEVTGLGKVKESMTDKEGNKREAEFNVFTKHKNLFAIILIAIAALIFVQSGGLELLGISAGGFGGGFTSSLSSPVVFFVIAMALIVWWVSAKS